MGISGKALRQLDASFAARSRVPSATVVIDDDILPQEEDSYFVNVLQMAPRKCYQRSAFLSDCDFVFGPDGRLIPDHSGEL